MTEMPPGTVTVADLYRELVGMRSDVARALERLSAIDTVNTNAERVHSDHEARLRALEAFRWKLAGASLVAGAASGGAATWIGFLITRH